MSDADEEVEPALGLPWGKGASLLTPFNNACLYTCPACGACVMDHDFPAGDTNRRLAPVLLRRSKCSFGAIRIEPNNWRRR